MKKSSNRSHFKNEANLNYFAHVSSLSAKRKTDAKKANKDFFGRLKEGIFGGNKNEGSKDS